MADEIPAHELAELEQIFAVAHGPEPTAAQREAVTAWDTLLAKDYAPRPTINVPAHPVARAKYPVIDVHKHLGYSPRRGWPSEVDELVEGMDRLNIRAFVNLDGLTGLHPTYFRVLETEDDLIIGSGGGRSGDAERGTLRAGTHPLYGLGLSDQVLRKLYHDNAARIFGLSALGD